MTSASKHPTRLAIALAFFCVYVFWGSSYLGMHYAGLYFSPPLVSGLRFLMATPVVFAICAWRGVRLRVTLHEFVRLAIVGLLLLTGNNVLLVWGEKLVDSGFAALVLAVVPIFVALLEWVLPDGEPVNALGWAGILLGVGGLVLLLWPTLYGGNFASGKILGCGILVLAGLSWAVGSVVSRRFALKVDPFVASSWQMLVAGVVNLSIATGSGAWGRAQWTRPGILSVVYLAVFSSMVAFTSYIYLLHHVPAAKAATYAYVNPLVAVLLGVVFAHERLVPLEYAGMAVVLVAVALVTMSKTRKADAGIAVEG